MSQHRTPSAVDAVADEYFDELVVIQPSISLFLGTENPHGFDDYSPEGLAAAQELRTRTLRKIDRIEARAAEDPEVELDATDMITMDALRERLGVADELHTAGLQHSVLNVIESPLQQMRDIFDILPTSTVQDWETIGATLSALPRSITGYIASLNHTKLSGGRIPAQIQIARVAGQARSLAEQGNVFDTLIARAESVPAALRTELTHGAEAARSAFAELTGFLATDLLPAAPETEACGRDEYALHSRDFLGSQVNLEETYEWAVEELAAIDAEQRRVAARIAPGVELFEVMAMLDNDPERALHGPEALREWMQGVADEAITELGKTHFDIPAPLRTIECMIAPSATGAVYYSQPSEDFSRPGRMWWSVPDGVTEFATWQEKTTVYHEGVPGHHLQMGQASYLSHTLNKWRRHVCWVSGHGEGWALYAEALMAELGYMDDPADYLGLLDSQRLRTARVVLDIGFHLGLRAPAHLGGGIWNRTIAWEFLTQNVATDHTFLAFELDRYLGWPGQAPSYKIGQRLWERIRDESRAAAGDRFDLKAFHSKALGLGSVGLDTLARAMSR